LVGQRKSFTFLWLTNRKFSEVKLQISWDRNAHNLAENLKFFTEIKTQIYQPKAKLNFPKSGPGN
jgi:hypothetical protein